MAVRRSTQLMIDGDGDAEDEVDERARGERLDGLGGVGLDLARLEGQLGHADGERHRGVLEEVQRLVGAGRDDEPERHRQDHVAIGLEGGEPGGHRGLELRARDGLDARAQHLGEARAAVDAERAHRRPELEPVAEEPLLDHLGQERRHREVPEEHPDQQRHVAEELHVEGGEPRAAAGTRTVRSAPETIPSADGEQPRERRQLERGDEPAQQPLAGLPRPQHRPVELVVHLALRPHPALSADERVCRPAGRAGVSAYFGTTCRSMKLRTWGAHRIRQLALGARTTCRRSRRTCRTRCRPSARR